MVSRLQVRHVSVYEYDAPVGSSFNEARLTPLATPWQNCLESMMYVDADGNRAVSEWSYSDYWGTWVRSFEVHAKHSRLSVENVALVEVDDSQRPQPDYAVLWQTMRGDDIYQGFEEYLSQTERSMPTADLVALADEVAAELAPHEAALEICRRVRETMTYVPGSTGVNTSASESWTAGTGVCQDYAHIVLGALRHIGLPARYVSGYLHPDAEPELGKTVTGESHAWVEWWLGTAAGGAWIGHDPTNGASIGERHVYVGAGRDYTDAPPLRGLVAGSASSQLTVKVELTRMA